MGGRSVADLRYQNWAPPGEILPTKKDNAWACEQGLGEKFCFMYSGTLGMKHRPELLQALAQDLEVRGDARLVVIADGAGADWLREKAKIIRQDVLKILPSSPIRGFPRYLGRRMCLSACSIPMPAPSPSLRFCLICARGAL